MPNARQVVTRSPHRRVGFVACPWFQSHPVEYESLLERDFIQLALLEHTVTSITHQPFVIDLGDIGRYTPDFLLTGTQSTIVVEVKPSEFCFNARNGPRLNKAAQILKDKNYRFLVATEKVIRVNDRHERAAILLRHARSHIPSDISGKILKMAANFQSGITVSSLAALAEVPSSVVLALIGRRLLRITRSLRCSNETLVYSAGVNHGRL